MLQILSSNGLPEVKEEPQLGLTQKIIRQKTNASYKDGDRIYGAIRQLAYLWE